MMTYIYEGPVMVFDRCVANNWRAETMAVSEGKARSNFAYQFKKAANLVANSKVKLVGKIREKEE